MKRQFMVVVLLLCFFFSCDVLEKLPKDTQEVIKIKSIHFKMGDDDEKIIEFNGDDHFATLEIGENVSGLSFTVVTTKNCQKIEYTIESEKPQEGKPSEEFKLSGEWENKPFLILRFRIVQKS